MSLLLSRPRNVILLAIVVLFVGLSTLGWAQSPLISEFMASNKAAYADDDGEYSDWLEIYNPSDATVSLGGWYLTDSASNKTKWTFPSVSVPSKGFLVVFASDKNRIDPLRPLHTNFKLSAGGEYLGLIKPDGTTVASEYSPNFPAQQTDVSYGMAFTGGGATLVAQGAPAKALLPTSNALGLTWTSRLFSDAGWTNGTTGVGYERSSGYESLIGLNLPAMYAQTATAYIRVPFTVSNPNQFDNQILRMKYDDGFVAYLNGVRVASANAPQTLQYNSSAVDIHEDNFAMQFQDFDITPFRSALVSGFNVLAIHGLNAGTTSSDFLILPQLEVSKLGDVQPSTLRYFSVPTPGAPNSAAADSGPAIGACSHAPHEPTDAQNVVVKVTVTPVSSPVSSVTLSYRVDYGSVAALAMYDDGAHGDGASEDGVYGATIPASASTQGQMVRYSITAKDAENRTSRWPLFRSANSSPEFFGWMVQDPRFTTPLPTLYWWVQDPAAAKTDTGTRASIYYLGEFYDNVFVRLRGQSSGWWPKPHYKFDLNDGFFLRWDDSAPRAEEFNLQSTYSDKSYIRQVLGWETYRDAGVPYCEAFPVRVQQNGAFHSVAVFLEQPDERLLTRNDMDADGALYKMYNECTDAYSNVEKKSREQEDNSDLQALITGIKLSGGALDQFMFDNIDVPQMINYVAATCIMHDNDHVAKNYYLYRDSDGNREWQFFPWDKDLTFGRNFWNWDVLNDVIVANYDPQSHPFFGDRNHPKIDGPWNRMIDAMLRSPRVKNMYLRRLRTLMDEMLQAPGTPMANRHFESRIDQLYGLMSTDVALDRSTWGNPYGQSQNFLTALTILKNQYLDVRRQHLFVTHSSQSGLIPQPQTGSPLVRFGNVEFDPVSGIQNEEYIEIVNLSDIAIDVSRWRIEGDVDHSIKPGSVIGPGETLYVSPDVVAFRSRSTAPTGGMSLFVQGDYSGHIPREAQDLVLRNASGEVVDTYRTAPVSGELILGDYLPTAASQDVAIEIRDTQGDVLETHTISGSASGSYSLLSKLRGTFTFAVKAGHWLRRVRAGVTIGPDGVSNLDFTLVNGDVDGDNVVTVFDYTMLSDAFDSIEGDANWSKNADLDGDGAVTVFDYSILSQNFDMVGD